MNSFQAIAAMSLNRVIGSGNRLPWHLPEDFKWFKSMTIGQVVLMGRKTFESIGRPLPQRTTWVLSRSPREIPGVQVFSSWAEIEHIPETRPVFVCGGADIYAQALPRCSDLYLTIVKRTVEGDAFFPLFEAEFDAGEVVLQREEFDIRHFRRRIPAAERR